MWTDRFIRIPVEIVKTANETLGDKEEFLCEDFMMINPFDIVAYRRHFNDDGEYDSRIVVEMRGMTNIIVQLSIHEFEKLLNNHQK